MANIVLQQKIHGRLELLALANSRTQQGDSRLFDFVLNRSQKKVNELVETISEGEIVSRCHAAVCLHFMMVYVSMS